MKRALASFLLLLVFSGAGFPQDLRVREEAVRLLERANQVSQSPKLPNLERVDTFQAFAGSDVREGSFSRMVIQGVGRRDEYLFGDFHLLNVWGHKQVAVTGVSAVIPAELVNMMRLTPIRLVRFDGEDVIHFVNSREVGSYKAKCVEFDTVRGQRTMNNELCVDADSGVLLEEKLGAELIENSEFFPFAGASFPGKIEYSVGGVKKMEITQSMKVLDEGEANVLSTPPGAQILAQCTSYRRPFGISMPQPKPGNGGSDAEVAVNAKLSPAGNVVDAVILNSVRPDLNEEALALAKQWTFTPAMCNGKPWQADSVQITLDFQGR